jgi:hypothetical protein
VPASGRRLGHGLALSNTTRRSACPLVDAGDAIAFLCQIRLRARASGIELDSRLGEVFWIERGLIVRESDFGDWDEALRALVSPPRMPAFP